MSWVEFAGPPLGESDQHLALATQVDITVLAAAEGERGLAARILRWSAGSRFRLNDDSERAVVPANGYLLLRRQWKPGDRVTVLLDMTPRRTYPDRRVDAVRGRVAVERGPLVYCFEQADQPGGARRRYTKFYRVFWRCMIPDDTDRSLFSAIYPPGPAHVDAVQSPAMAATRDTSLVAGLFSALPVDYLLRVTGRTHFRISDARVMPALETNHPLTSQLILRTLRLNCRTLRLNCLTTAYANLWAGLYEGVWRKEQWVVD